MDVSVTRHARQTRRHLDGAECRRLLGSASIGRIGFTLGALPAIAPVPYLLRDQELVLIALARDDPIVPAVRGAVVAFQVDSYRDGDADRTIPGTGWSVTVVGPSTAVLPTAAAATELARLWPADPEDGPCWIAIPLDRVTGWSGSVVGVVAGPRRRADGARPLRPLVP